VLQTRVLCYPIRTPETPKMGMLTSRGVLYRWCESTLASQQLCCAGITHLPCRLMPACQRLWRLLHVTPLNLLLCPLAMFNDNYKSVWRLRATDQLQIFLRELAAWTRVCVRCSVSANSEYPIIHKTTSVLFLYAGAFDQREHDAASSAGVPGLFVRATWVTCGT
jgi:hypothetical protein